LVTKVHSQAQRYASQGYELIIIGHQKHPEVEGTRGSVQGIVHVLSTPEEVMTLNVHNPEKLAYVTQTTLSIDDTRDVITTLLKRFPHIQGPQLSDICYATQNRQNAIRELVKQIDVLLVVGSANSSNSNRLREVGENAGIVAYLIDNETAIQAQWFTPDMRVGVTAGASAPEILVQQVLEKLRELGVSQISVMEGQIETTTFRIPAELLAKKSAS
jgi:4-hydroxy-3-methylbut-2-enyl diphosphate reductase